MDQTCLYKFMVKYVDSLRDSGCSNGEMHFFMLSHAFSGKGKESDLTDSLANKSVDAVFTKT